MKKFLFCFFLISNISHPTSVFSQENIYTVGFQIKPMLVSSFFNTGKGNVTHNNVGFTVLQQSGFCAGMIIRRGFTKRFSMEFGINYVKRNYSLSIKDSSFVDKSHFSTIGYEIPVMGMIFLKLSQKLFMNTGFGVSCDMYPSDVTTSDDYFTHYSERHSLFQSAVLANVAFEYRTAKSGYFNMGASYHLPFTNIYYTNIEYVPIYDFVQIKLPGNYLTIDFRYFFYEKPIKPKVKKKK